MGLDSEPLVGADSSHQAALTRKHLELIRSDVRQCDSDTVLVSAIEANLAYVIAHTIGCIFEEPHLQPVEHCRIKKSKANADLIGIWMDDQIKLHMIHLLGFLLSEGRVRFAPDVISAGRRGWMSDAYVSTPQELKEKLGKQLLGFRRFVREPPNEFTQQKEVYTGKSGKGNDDLVMALMIAVYHAYHYSLQLNGIQNAPKSFDGIQHNVIRQTRFAMAEE